MVLGGRYTPYTTGPGSQWCPFAQYGALQRPVQVTRVALVAHRYTYAPPSCRTSQYHRTFITLSVSLFNDIGHPVFDGILLAPFLYPTVFPLSHFIPWK